MITKDDPIPAETQKPWVVARLQPFPPVAARLMRKVATDEVNFRGVAGLIRSDTAFSTEVLRLANSPLLGCRRKVLSILHAVAILGLERVKALVMMVALRDFLSASQHMPALVRCWRHSLAAAYLTQDIGVACWLDRDQSYTAGLMHDLGRMALLATYPGEYATLLDDLDRSGRDPLEAERKKFEIDHCAVGCWLISEWDLPEDFLAIVGTHHSEPRQDIFEIADAVRVGCRLADRLGFQVAGPAPSSSFDDLVAHLPAGAAGKLKPEAEMALDLADRINAVECSLM